MRLDDYTTVPYHNQPVGWVAEVPAIPGCYALMDSRVEALVEFASVFQMITEEYAERNEMLPAGTIEIVRSSSL